LLLSLGSELSLHINSLSKYTKHLLVPGIDSCQLLEWQGLM